jgi:hypothetical protein
MKNEQLVLAFMAQHIMCLKGKGEFLTSRKNVIADSISG